jgi:haloacid dehalogenase-like hydrolase
MTGKTDPLPSWSETPTKQSILEFVAAVSDPSSDELVPEEDRIAVFDNDGTLWAEMPMYAQLAFALDRAAELGHPTTPEELRAGGLGAVLELVKLTHGNVTTDEFETACRRWMASARHPRTGDSYLSSAYQPMLELLSFLDDRGFSCWIFSGGGADFMRTWSAELYGLPPHRVIGSIGTTEFKIGDAGPELVKGTDLQILNDGPQKPVSIHTHVGQRPILAAGNTDGDLPMLQWTAASPYRTLGIAVHHTDEAREFAYDSDPLLGSGTEQLLDAAAKNDWTVVDMATDWLSVFPQNPKA